jgi:gas vesicle protein
LPHQPFLFYLFNFALFCYILRQANFYKRCGAERAVGGLAALERFSFMNGEIERRRRRTSGKESDMGARLTYLLVGAGVGAVVALLFAPKSGHELRSDIADATRKGIDRTRDAATQIGGRAGDYYEGARERAGELYSAGLEKAGEVASAAREVAQRRGGGLSAAIEAGKQAYREEKRRTEVTGLPGNPPYYEAPKG